MEDQCMTRAGRKGRVFLVGAGPGDPDLITMRGVKMLRSADVVLYDRLVASDLLAFAEFAELIDVGKVPGSHRLTQEGINRLIVDQAMAGRCVVRLKGGDPLTFGRGHEEYIACVEHGIECEIIPGVSSVHAVPAAAGIPLTHRGVASSFVVITGRSRDGELPDHDFDALAGIDTLVVLMGLSTLREITGGLLAAGRDADTPAAVIASGTTPSQRTVRGTLKTIADAAMAARLESPAITIIGKVAMFGNADDLGTQTQVDLPLHRRRVVVTQAASTSTRLQQMLSVQGAEVVNVPLIKIAFPESSLQLRETMRLLATDDFDVIAFTSVHGVRGFRFAMENAGIQMSAIRHARVAVLGAGTAEEVRKIGLTPDIIPTLALADQLVVAIDGGIARSHIGPRRVLFPRSNRALPTLKRGLMDRGFHVVDPVVYETSDCDATNKDLAILRRGFDVILFCSPSAVQRFTTLGIGVGNALVGCIGPTTAESARDAGQLPDIVPNQPGSRGLVDALVERIRSKEATSCLR